MMNTSTNSTIPENFISIDPFSTTKWMNWLASFCYFATLAGSLFLFWISYLERSKTFSQFRPVTQQLISFSYFQVSKGILIEVCL